MGGGTFPSRPLRTPCTASTDQGGSPCQTSREPCPPPPTTLTLPALLLPPPPPPPYCTSWRRSSTLVLRGSGAPVLRCSAAVRLLRRRWCSGGGGAPAAASNQWPEAGLKPRGNRGPAAGGCMAQRFHLVTKANPAQYMKNMRTFFFLELHMFYNKKLRNGKNFEKMLKKKGRCALGGIGFYR